MGMFDYFEIAENLLPKKKRIDNKYQAFQTKDFDCNLETYEVDENGNLFRTVYDDSRNLNYDNPQKAPHRFTGSINFYDMENDFVAWCVNGVVKEVIDLTEEQP